MTISEVAQQLLVQLWMAVEEKKDPNFLLTDAQHNTVHELAHLGMLEQNGRQVMLTTAGRSEAARWVRRQRLGERLLTDVFTTDGIQTGEQTCSLECALWGGQEDSICTLLGHPQVCPHGRPIPPGPCCLQKRTSVNRLIAPLSELEPGQHGHIAYVNTHHAQHLPKLMAMGILPGVTITLLRRSPSFVFEAGYSQFAVDAEIAAEINVSLSEINESLR